MLEEEGLDEVSLWGGGGGGLSLGFVECLGGGGGWSLGCELWGGGGGGGPPPRSAAMGLKSDGGDCEDDVFPDSTTRWKE